MMFRIIVVLTALTLISCSKGQEIQLLSKDNRHMLYLFPEDGSAEHYTGMSMIADYTLTLENKIYTLMGKQQEVSKIELMLDTNTTNWVCRGCKTQGLSSQWIQQ